MKTKIQYIKLCCLVGVVSLFLSCADSASMDPVPEQESVRVALFPGVRADYSAGSLKYEVYVFQSPENENNFTFLNMLSPFVSGTPLDLDFADLVLSDYRFLFIAIPADFSGQTIITEYSGAGDSVPVTGLSSGCPWSDVRFNHPGVTLNGDYYYGVTDMSGQEIIDAGEVNGTLDRVVGQMVYDIFKTNGTVNDPVGIPADADVVSVLDRVYQIDIVYQGVTERLMFDETELIPDPSVGTITYTEEIGADEIGFDRTTGKVTPGEKSSGAIIESYLPENTDATSYTGAVRIRGAYLLPATGGVTVHMTFHYYDTTPTCGNVHAGGVSTHDMDECYPKETITLNLPQTGSLKIQSNYFTANKAGIPCNRVIEVPVQTVISVDTDWEESEAGAPVVNP